MPLDKPLTHPVYEKGTFQGRVIKTQSGFYTVETEDGPIVSQISGRLKASREDQPITADLVALGDFVTTERQEDGSGFIVDVHQRQHTLSRVASTMAAGTAAESEQIIIANCDQAIFVLAAKNPRPQPRMLDRLLVAAEKAKIPSIVICVNKIDLVKREQAEALFAPYIDIGYQVIFLSVKEALGIHALRDALANKVSVLTGPSGVGKSSLLNALQPGLTLQTAHVSDANAKGRHTTRFSQLVALDEGGYMADTPGIRAIAPWDVEPDELDHYYREISQHVPNCRFTDCSHMHEPGCAVRKAVQNGEITEERYESYLRMREELEEQYVYL